MGVDRTNSDIQCVQCRQLFQSEDERGRHSLKEHGDLVSPETQGHCEEHFICTTCARHFGTQQTLQLHQQEHRKNAECELSLVQIQSVENNDEKTKFDAFKNIKLEPQTVQTSKEQLLFQSTAAARKAGLTKIRLEDCFRCDACSCIYLEEDDYHKHMKNVHKNPLRKKMQKKTCRSCCKNCNCTKGAAYPSVCRTTNRSSLHVDIKDRWRRIISPQPIPTKPSPTVKTEPEMESPDELDYSELLGQVEVRIKTETEGDNQPT